MIKDKEYVVYEGKVFTIEWYHDAKGKSQPYEYYQELDAEQKAKFLSLVMWMGDIGKIRNEQKFRNEGDKIYAFKPKPDRFLCFFTDGRKIIITNAFVKKQDKIPPGEKDRALRHMADYQDRTKKRKYYDG